MIKAGETAFHVVSSPDCNHFIVPPANMTILPTGSRKTMEYLDHIEKWSGGNVPRWNGTKCPESLL
jgi:hypothetical protein